MPAWWRGPFCAASSGFDVHAWKPGHLYRGEGPGEWAVEAVFEGPAVIGAALERATKGIVHLRNQELGYRIITAVDDRRLDKLTRI